MRIGLKAAALAAAIAAALPAAAQERRPDLRDWQPDTVYRNGWSAEEMLDKPVRSATGEQIGEVEDIIVDRNGRISKIVVEVGGFLELGDQHIGVPWQDISIGEDMKFVQVPLKEVEDGTYSLFGRVPRGEDVPAALTAWRVNELIGDYAALTDVPRYGVITDVIFSASGRAKAVVVDPAIAWGGHGPYAYPWVGYYPASYTYPLPYRSETVADLAPFNYAELARQSAYAGDAEEGNASTGASAKSTTALTVQRAPSHGRYIADASGRAVYLLEADRKGESRCHGECAKVWPPLLAPQGEPRAAEQAVREELIGTLERPDGRMQVTYNGHPLYYYVKDRGAGRTTGQDVHDKWGEWYLVTPTGAKLEGGGT